MPLTVRIPAMLAHCTGGEQTLSLVATSLGDGLDSLWKQYPLLRQHCCQKEGEIRPHVLLFFNDENILWLESLDIEISEGDCLTILQAVSGGCTV